MVEEQRKVQIFGLVAVAVICGFVFLSNRSQAQEEIELAPLPPGADLDPKQVAIGKLLFFDSRLSGDGSMSCATCHNPKTFFTDGEALSKGYPGSLYFRNTPTVVNSHQARYLYWDGRLPASDLETLVRDHISEAHFLNADGRLVVERLRQVPEYEEGFKQSFGGEPSYGRILKAVSVYLKSLNSENIPFDRYLGGDENAISGKAKAGLALFKGKAGCIQCHSGPMLADGKFHRLGVPENPRIFQEPERHITFRRFLRTLGVPKSADLREDIGLYAITKQDEDRKKFRTPSLREVARTAPYMHNGIFPTLEEVIDFYNQGGGKDPEKDLLLKPIGLTASEEEELVAFLQSLSGEEFTTKTPEVPAYKLREIGKN